MPSNTSFVANETELHLTLIIEDDVIIENQMTTVVLSVNSTDLGFINDTAVLIILDNDGK